MEANTPQQFAIGLQHLSEPYRITGTPILLEDFMVTQDDIDRVKRIQRQFQFSDDDQDDNTCYEKDSETSTIAPFSDTYSIDDGMLRHITPLALQFLYGRGYFCEIDPRRNIAEQIETNRNSEKIVKHQLRREVYVQLTNDFSLNMTNRLIELDEPIATTNIIQVVQQKPELKGLVEQYFRSLMNIEYTVADLFWRLLDRAHQQILHDRFSQSSQGPVALEETLEGLAADGEYEEYEYFPEFEMYHFEDGYTSEDDESSVEDEEEYLETEEARDSQEGPLDNFEEEAATARQTQFQPFQPFQSLQISIINDSRQRRLHHTITVITESVLCILLVVYMFGS